MNQGKKSSGKKPEKIKSTFEEHQSEEDNRLADDLFTDDPIISDENVPINEVEFEDDGDE